MKAFSESEMSVKAGILTLLTNIKPPLLSLSLSSLRSINLSVVWRPHPTTTTTMSSSSSSSTTTTQSAAAADNKKQPWWVSTRQMVERYVRDAKSLAATQSPSDVEAALGLAEAALALSPRAEAALEAKARCLLLLRRFREVADMLQEYIPSFKADVGDEGDHSSTSIGSSSENSTGSGSKVKLLGEGERRSSVDGGGGEEKGFRCFSVADLIKRKVLAGRWAGCDDQGQWRYLVLGQACCHLGLMEDAMALLQTCRRLATAASRRESVCWSDDSFTSSDHQPSPTPPPPESSAAAHLLAHIKLLLRRRSAALAALDAGLPSEAVRHFSKILDSRRGTPHAFAASCLVGRASAYRLAARPAEAIADCNRALALDPTSIPALRLRADILAAVRAVPECLRDLDHLKLLYDAVLRDRKLPGPAWRRHHGIRYRDIPASLRSVTHRIHELRTAASGGNAAAVIDYYALIGVRRGCTRSELERAHLLLSLRHKPDKSAAFVERLEFAGGDHRDLDAVRDQARMSALILYRMLQKGYSHIMSVVMDQEAADRQRIKEAKEVAAAAAATVANNAALKAATASAAAALQAEKTGQAAVFQGVFCRDLAAVGSLISHAGFGLPIPVKYEGLSC